MTEAQPLADTDTQERDMLIWFSLEQEALTQKKSGLSCALNMILSVVGVVLRL